MTLFPPLHSADDIETNHATSFDCCGERGSITEDSWWAFVNNVHENRFAWCNGTLIEQSPFTINDFRKQRKRWMSGHLSMIRHHPAPWKQKIIFTLQVFGWSTIPLLFVCLVIDVFVFGGSGLVVETPTFVIFTKINAVGACIFGMMYTLGILLMIHKNWLEKAVCFFLALPLFPIILAMETSGVLSAFLFPDKGFVLVRKEGMSVKRMLSSESDSETKKLLV